MREIAHLCMRSARDAGAPRPAEALGNSVMWCAGHFWFAKVLTLSHEDATLQEQMPYLSVLWHPLPVLQAWGRSASRAPRCKREQAVFYFWWRELNWV